MASQNSWNSMLSKGTCLLRDKGSTPAWLQVFHMLCKPMKWNPEHVLHHNILDEQLFDIWKNKNQLRHSCNNSTFIKYKKKSLVRKSGLMIPYEANQENKKKQEKKRF